MILGLVSDSHGKGHHLRAGMDLFAARHVEVVVHCGDIILPEHVEILASLGCAAYLVMGNMDRRIEGLAEATERWCVHYHPDAVEVPLGDGEYLVATHGSDRALLEDLIGDPQFPYVCHGHTHDRRDERIGITRVINPGALHHVHPRTVAVLNTETDELEFMEITG